MLKILYNTTDYSKELTNFIYDTATITLATGANYLFIGLYKPFQRVHLELSTVSTGTRTVTAEYYNGTSWVALSEFIDNTNGFTRSGEMTWNLSQTGWSKYNDYYYVRLSVNTSTSAMVVKGIGMIFAQDFDLVEGYRGVNDLKYSGDSSFINYHQGAKNEILQLLRNSGKFTTAYELTEWDLLKPEQLREAGKWKALELLFTELSNEVGDKYDSLAQKCKAKFDTAFNLYLLSIDVNDDGVLTTAEEYSIEYVAVERI